MKPTLDRIAQAIGRAAGRADDIADWPEPIQEHYRKLARAAIAAARGVVRDEQRRGVAA